MHVRRPKIPTRSDTCWIANVKPIHRSLRSFKSCFRIMKLETKVTLSIWVYNPSMSHAPNFIHKYSTWRSKSVNDRKQFFQTSAFFIKPWQQKFSPKSPFFSPRFGLVKNSFVFFSLVKRSVAACSTPSVSGVFQKLTKNPISLRH